MSSESVRPTMPAVSARWAQTLRALDGRVLVPTLVLTAIGLVSLAADSPVAMAAQARWTLVEVAVLLASIVVPYRRFLAPWLVYALRSAHACIIVFATIPFKLDECPSANDIGPEPRYLQPTGTEL